MPITCQYCNNSFSRKDNLLRHLKDKSCRWLKIEFDKVPQQLKKSFKTKIVLKNKFKQVYSNLEKNKEPECKVKKLEKDKTDQEISKLQNNINKDDDQTVT